MTLRIVSRNDWGAQFNVRPITVPITQRRFFVVHWPGGAVLPDERATIRGIERFHRVNKGWNSAPGYNFFVGQSGTIYEGCGLNQIGAHSRPRNRDGIGVCVLQGTNQQVSQAALNSTRALYDQVSAAASRQLIMSYHAADWATQCAGPQLNSWVRSGMPTATIPIERQFRMDREARQRFDQLERQINSAGSGVNMAIRRIIDLETRVKEMETRETRRWQELFATGAPRRQS